MDPVGGGELRQVYCSHWYLLSLIFFTTLAKSFLLSKSWVLADCPQARNKEFLCLNSWFILKAFTVGSRQNKGGAGKKPGYYKVPKKYLSRLLDLMQNKNNCWQQAWNKNNANGTARTQNRNKSPVFPESWNMKGNPVCGQSDDFTPEPLWTRCVGFQV